MQNNPEKTTPNDGAVVREAGAIGPTGLPEAAPPGTPPGPEIQPREPTALSAPNYRTVMR